MTENESKPTVAKPIEHGPETRKYHYIKGNGFRVIHVDGAIGGPTPPGGIHVALFSERLPIPIESVHEVKDGLVLGTPLEASSREGIVREVEADLIMTVEVARRLSEWLASAATRTEALRRKASP